MYALGFSPDGRTLATGSGDSKVRLWSVPAGDLVGSSGAFRRDGEVLATAGRDGRIRLWNVTDPARPVALGRPFTPVVRAPDSQVLFSPDGRVLAVLTTGRVQLWNVTDPAHPTPYGPALVLRSRFMGPDALAFSPDGRTLATAYDSRRLQLWDVTDPAHPVSHGPIAGHRGYIDSLVFSPDGRTLASGSADGTIRLWKVTDPARPTPLGRPLTGHTGPPPAMWRGWREPYPA